MKNKNNELRKFSLIFSGYFILLTILFLKIHHKPIQFSEKWLFLPLFISCFLLYPKILMPLKTVWDFLLKILHWINIRLLLGAIFFLLFSPIAFFRRLIGKDAFNLNFNPSATTYRTAVIDNNDLRRPY